MGALENENASLPAGSFRLNVLHEGSLVKTLTFDKAAVTLGRDEGCDVLLDSRLVSRRHAEIRQAEELYAVVDLKSANGIVVNGRPVVELAPLSSGDRLTIGPFEIHFVASKIPKLEVPEGAGPGDKVCVGPGDKMRLGTTPPVPMVLPPMPPQRVRELEAPQNLGFVVFAREGGQTRQMVLDHFQIGSCPDCEFRLTMPGAPWKLAILLRGSDRYRIYSLVPDPEALKVNGKPVKDWAGLADKDTIEVEGRKIVFEQAPRQRRQDSTLRAFPLGN